MSAVTATTKVVISSLEQVEELKTGWEQISTNVNRYWRSGVTNKLKLAQEIKKYYDFQDLPQEEVVSGEEVISAYVTAQTTFFKSLPFGKKVADKFNRIANAKWLNEKGLDISILPNCYNTLEKLASKEVCENPEVVEYLKENVTSSDTREDVSSRIRKATSDETDDEGKVEKDESNETRNALLLSIKIDNKNFGSTDDVARLWNTAKAVEGFIKRTSKEAFGDADGKVSELNGDIFNIEIKDSVFNTLSKKARKSEVDDLDWKTLLPIAV